MLAKMIARIRISMVLIMIKELSGILNNSIASNCSCIKIRTRVGMFIRPIRTSSSSL